MPKTTYTEKIEELEDEVVALETSLAEARTIVDVAIGLLRECDRWGVPFDVETLRQILIASGEPVELSRSVKN